MRWPRFPRNHRDRRSSPLDDLLGELDRLAVENGAAAKHARDIRRHGDPALQRSLGECAAGVLQCKAFLTSTPVIAAFARYELEANGNDWDAIPHEVVRARQAATRVAELPALAQQHRAEAIGRINVRRNARALGAIQGGHR